MSKHTGIKRLAKNGDSGKLIGWGYLEHGTAMLNMQKDDGEIVGIPCKPEWAKETLLAHGDAEVMLHSAMGSFECGFKPANFLIGSGKSTEIEERKP